LVVSSVFTSLLSHLGELDLRVTKPKDCKKKKKKNLPSRKTVKMLLALYKGDHIFCSFYSGECWSGPDDSAFYLEGHAPLEGCADQCINDCAYSTRFCAGKNFTNAVYAISKHYEVARL